MALTHTSERIRTNERTNERTNKTKQTSRSSRSGSFSSGDSTGVCSPPAQRYLCADTPVAIVTGGERGIGAEVVETLSDLGFSVIVACRDPLSAMKEYGASVKRKMTGAPGNTDGERNASVRFQELDLSKLRSVRRFARRFARSTGNLRQLRRELCCGFCRQTDGAQLLCPKRRDIRRLTSTFGPEVIVNNAGCIQPLRRESPQAAAGGKEGGGRVRKGLSLETTWCTNHLGHWYLTTSLVRRYLAEMQALGSLALPTSPPHLRVVTVASSAHAFARGAGLDFSDLQWQRRKYSHHRVCEFARESACRFPHTPSRISLSASAYSVCSSTL